MTRDPHGLVTHRQPRPGTLRLVEAISSTEGALLRNTDVCAALDRGGDIDVLVPDLQFAEAQLHRSLGAPRVAYKRSYVWSLHYDWGHVDLFPSVEWRGASYLRTSAVLSRRRQAVNGPPRVGEVDEAIICWLTSVLWGGFFKQRYAELIQEAARDDCAGMSNLLREALGARWGARLMRAVSEGRPEMAQEWTAQLRRTVRRRAARRAPATFLLSWSAFWWREVALRLRPPLPWVAVLGPDGSGKSSAIAAFVKLWPADLGQVHTHHWRPHRLDPRKGVVAPVSDPHGKPARGTLASLAKLLWITLDWWAGTVTVLVHQRARKGLVVFDRHYLDLLVDPQRYRYGGPRWAARLTACLVPVPDVIVVLDAPVAVLHGRKMEVPAPVVEKQRVAYKALARRSRGGVVVDASQGLEHVAEQMVDHVMLNVSGRGRR